jgi:hypothetical protein
MVKALKRMLSKFRRPKAVQADDQCDIGHDSTYAETKADREKAHMMNGAAHTAHEARRVIADETRRLELILRKEFDAYGRRGR